MLEDGAKSYNSDEADFQPNQTSPVYHPKKRGRKPLPNSAERRKEQNKVAQKTFREKKTKRLRDLETRVEAADDERILSFKIIQDLINENNTLRERAGQKRSSMSKRLAGTELAHVWDDMDSSGWLSKSQYTIATETVASPNSSESATPTDSPQSIAFRPFSDTQDSATSISTTSHGEPNNAFGGFTGFLPVAAAEQSPMPTLVHSPPTRPADLMSTHKYTAMSAPTMFSPSLPANPIAPATTFNDPLLAPYLWSGAQNTGHSVYTHHSEANFYAHSPIPYTGYTTSDPIARGYSPASISRHSPDLFKWLGDSSYPSTPPILQPFVQVS